MKKPLYGIVFCISIILTACAQTRNIQEEAYVDEPSNPISYQQFYDDLSPYGQWISSSDFGYVWVPGVNNFRPYYSNGYWAYTNYGWTWVSDYNWGWAPFHYGRWYYDNFYGWAWVPGYEWAPAWVSWRSNSQYYGWAPLCPQGRNGRYYEIRNDQWAFVPHQYINKRNVNNYYVNQQNNTTIINNTTEINKVRVINKNTKYEEGPNVADVEKVTNTKIRALQVKQSSVPGTKLQNGALKIYKPTVQNNTGGNIKPPKVVETGTSSATATQPANETPKTNNLPKIISAENNDNRVTTKPAPVKLNNDRIKVNPPAVNNNNNNSNETLTQEDKTVRQFPAEQNQPNNNPRPNPKIRSINNNDNIQQEPRIQQVPRQNRTNIEVPERREVAPQQSPGKINQRERTVNQQQQNPVIIRQPVRERTAPVNRPSNSFEQRPQPVRILPQSPGKLNEKK